MPNEKSVYEIDLKDSFSGKLKGASHNLDNFENKIKKVSGGTTGGSGGLIGSLGGAFARFLPLAALATGVTMFTEKMVTLGAELEQTKVAFDVLVGSHDKAEKLLSGLTNIANITPFSNKDIYDSAKLLLSFGTSVKDVLPTVNMLGDIAMGNSEKLGSLTLAFAQMSSAGRLMGQDLLQMINAGFNPLQEISKITGRKMKDLKKDMENGAISVEMVKAAFVHATSEGGTFFQMNQKMSETMSGKWSTFMGTLEYGIASLGEKLKPVVNLIIDGLMSGLDILQRLDFSPLTSQFSILYEEISEFFSVIGELWDSFGLGIEKIDVFQMLVNSLAMTIRAVLIPFKLLIEGLTIMWKLLDNVKQGFVGLGEVLVGVFQSNVYLIKDGLSKMASAVGTGLQEVKDQATNFAKREYEGFSHIFGKPDKSKGEQAEDPRFKFDRSAFGSMSATQGAGGGKRSLLDGEVRSGGVKNIVINITNLAKDTVINANNFKGDPQEAIRIFKELLLTAVNDVNLATE